MASAEKYDCNTTVAYQSVEWENHISEFISDEKKLPDGGLKWSSEKLSTSCDTVDQTEALRQVLILFCHSCQLVSSVSFQF